MLNVAITMMNEELEVLEEMNVQIISGVEQAKDHMLDAMYQWLDSRQILVKEFGEYEENPVLFVQVKSGATFTIGANMQEAETI